MKIVFISQDGLSTINFCRWFAAALRRRSDVTFCTMSSRDVYSREIDDLGTRHIDVAVDRFVSPLGDLRYFLAVRRILKEERFDVAVTFGTKPNIYAALAARSARVPKVVMAVRGLGRPFSEPTSIKERGVSWVARRLYGKAARAAHRVWFTNRADLKYFVEAGIVAPSKTFLTTNAVSLEFFSADRVDPHDVDAARRELGIRAGDFVVIMVARRVWSKGIREFVDAARLLQRLRRAKFVLVAPAEDRGGDAVPESYVSESRSLPNLIWLGFRKDVRELYALADLAVLPSYYKEGGYPRALLEPMALGKPVIAADTDDCRGPVEELGNGYLVPPRDAAALAARIEGLYGDEETCRRFGARSLDMVRTRFNDEIVGRQVLNELGVEI